MEKGNIVSFVDGRESYIASRIFWWLMNTEYSVSDIIKSYLE